MKQIAFIGAGKVGTALGMYFHQKGLMITGYLSKTIDSAREASYKTNSKTFDDLPTLLTQAKIIFITTNDDEISTVSKELYETNLVTNQHVLIHTSGAHSSKIFNDFDSTGCGLYSIHPLQSFSDLHASLQQLEETVFTLEGNGLHLETIDQIFSIINNPYFKIKKELKPLYHAGACMISNYLVTLMDKSFDLFEKSGMNRESIFEAVAPLIYSTLNNIKLQGTKKSLTGPIARGDLETIKTHQKYMNKAELEFYQFMGIQTLELIKNNKLSPDVISKLEKILRGEINE